MAAELIDLIRSLTSIMEEETMRLRTRGRSPDLVELALAKAKLVTALDTATARLSRQNRDWLTALGPEERDELIDALRTMKDASAPNQAALERQIELSTEILAAVATEAKRLTGNRHAVYGAAGRLSQIELATPISINSQF